METISNWLYDTPKKLRWTLRAIIFPLSVTAEPGENVLKFRCVCFSDLAPFLQLFKAARLVIAHFESL